MNSMPRNALLSNGIEQGAKQICVLQAAVAGTCSSAMAASNFTHLLDAVHKIQARDELLRVELAL